MAEETQERVVPSVDGSIDTLVYGLWLVIQGAKEAYANHGNTFLQTLADRQMRTPMPEDAGNKCLHKMLTELTLMLARSKRQ